MLQDMLNGFLSRFLSSHWFFLELGEALEKLFRMCCVKFQFKQFSQCGDIQGA